MSNKLIENQRTIPPLLKGSHYLTLPRKPWMVKGIIREGTTVFLSGKEGTGKSIIALEFASCYAEGRDFFGHETSKGDVLYIAAERGDSQRDRLEALRDAKGVNPNCITFIDHQFKLNLIDHEELLIEALDQGNYKPKLIVIDTLRASLDGDENSSANAQLFMDALTRIRRRFDGTILVVHHVNAFGESRGSSAFIGAADTELYVTNSKKTGRVFLTVRKQNNGRTWTKLLLTPQELDFGNDYSSIVLNLVDSEPLESLPASDDEDSNRDSNIIKVVDSISEPITIFKLQQELAVIEGQLRNRAKLKDDVERLAKNKFVVFEEIDGGKWCVKSVVTV